MIPFSKPGRSASYADMGSRAAKLAMDDAGIAYSDIQQAFVGHVYGDSTSGQRALYTVGMTGIPIVNVNNTCSTGSTALFLARTAVQSGQVDCALALGFEQMVAGAVATVYNDRPTPFDHFVETAEQIEGHSDSPLAPRLFGGAGLEHHKRYGTSKETFAKVAVKARRHAAHNELALFRDPLSLEEVLGSPHICGLLTRFQCCPPTCGAAAAVVCSHSYAKRRGLSAQVGFVAQEMVTDVPSTFEEKSMIKLIGYDMAVAASKRAYERAGIGPEDIDVVELHDCFTSNEIICYEALGLTPEGTAEKFVADGANTYGGTVVTNPSGGLLSKGHPLGATGLAQCCELVWQLRGTAAGRQVENARLALQHNLGLGGACVVTIYQRQ